MADERKYFVLCANNCKFESMTKEQILTAIEQAVNDGKITDVDTGFISNIKEQNNGAGLKFWVGTQAQYNAIETKTNNCFYIITDDTTDEDLNNTIKDIYHQIDATNEDLANTNEYLTQQVEGLKQAVQIVAGGQNPPITEQLDAILQTMTSYGVAHIVFTDDDLDPELTHFCGTLYKTPNEAILDATNTNYGLQIKRTKFNGEWGEYEWVNPPMNFNHEYRTTERCNGSPVYVKRFYVGELPVSSSKVVEIDFDYSYIIDAQGIAVSSMATIPFYSLGININFEEGMLIVATENNASLYEGYILVKYYK